MCIQISMLISPSSDPCFPPMPTKSQPALPRYERQACHLPRPGVAGEHHEAIWVSIARSRRAWLDLSLSLLPSFCLTTIAAYRSIVCPTRARGLSSRSSPSTSTSNGSSERSETRGPWGNSSLMSGYVDRLYRSLHRGTEFRGEGLCLCSLPSRRHTHLTRASSLPLPLTRPASIRI